MILASLIDLQERIGAPSIIKNKQISFVFTLEFTWTNALNAFDNCFVSGSYPYNNNISQVKIFSKKWWSFYWNYRLSRQAYKRQKADSLDVRWQFHYFKNVKTISALMFSRKEVLIRSLQHRNLFRGVHIKNLHCHALFMRIDHVYETMKTSPKTVDNSKKCCHLVNSLKRGPAATI